MTKHNLKDLLAHNTYPGRGIVMGRSSDGQQAYIAYFIMGRSENSRNRVFTEKAGGIVTEAADPAKMQDPSLVIYAPVRRMGAFTIVTNGDQTDTIYRCLEREIPFEEALRTRTFEPDAPNFTPRISGLLSSGINGFGYKLSILKSSGGNPDSVQRMFFEYLQPVPGEGHLIHTYQQDGDPLPSFLGEPRCVAIEGTIEEFGKTIWDSLDPDNKISLFVRALTLDGNEQTMVYNRYQKVEETGR